MIYYYNNIRVYIFFLSRVCRWHEFIELLSLLQDELARVFVTLFDAKHLLAPLLWNMFYKEVEVSDCMQTLFRGNSLASKVNSPLFSYLRRNYESENSELHLNKLNDFNEI